MIPIKGVLLMQGPKNPTPPREIPTRPDPEKPNDPTMPGKDNPVNPQEDQP